MAIKEVLELVGSDVVIKQLNDVQKAGEQTLAVFNKPLPELKFPEPDTKPTEQMTGHVVKLKDALHTLKPILQAAGVQIGEFGAFARLASGSVIGLATALGGAVVVGLAKLEENAARTRGILTDLFGSAAKGDQAFDALGKQAKQFGTTVDNLAPGLEAFQTALNAVNRTAAGFVALKAEDLPGAQIAKNADAVSTAYGNFLKLLRAGRLTQDDAEKSAKAFFDTLKEGGTVTSAALKNLPVGTINLLKEALGAAGLTTQAFFTAVDQGTISVDKLQQALLAFSPQAERAFNLKAIKTFGDEIGRLLASLNKGFEGLTGKAFSDFVIAQISSVRKGIEDSVAELEKVVELIRRAEKATEIPGIGELVTRLRGAPAAGVTTGPTLEQAGLAGKGEAFFPTPEQAGKAGAAAGEAFQQGFLKKGFVFPPTEAEQAGTDIATSLTKGINKAVTAPTVEATEALVAPIKTIIETGLTVPAEAQQNLVNQFAQTGTQSGENFNTGFQTSIPQTLTLFEALYQQITALFAQPIPVKLQGEFNNPLQSTAPFASGGMVRGPGSSTSDSILAWLSNREFVVNAKAVSHYGPDFFAALNAMRLPQNFNMGGMARMMAGNKFAAGGMVKGNPVVLNIDRKSFNMTAGDDTITQLKRFAVTSQLSSTGRKPRWVK